jgi:ketosteroid isomerase-like protein
VDQPSGDQAPQALERRLGLAQTGRDDDALPDSSAEDIATVKAAFEAFARRDLSRLEELTSATAAVYNPITGAVAGRTRYVGRDALLDYLADVERVWTRLELRPRTFQSSHPGEVLVVGHVHGSRGGDTRDVPAAWRWTVANGEITFVEILRTPEALAWIG